VIPDLGNVPTLEPYRSLGDAVALHVLMMSIYVGAFAVGRVVDRRYEALLQRAEEASREAAHKLAQLADAREELDVLLAREQQGIFSGLRLGAYRLGPLLGRGGMGEVYEATGDDGAPVALKLVRGDRVADPRNLRLFLDEAEALGRVRSPHVARILAVGGIEQELPFIAMEYIDGQTLGDVLRGGRLPAGEAASLLRDVARGLADVHDAGVLHLDVKPHNVILGEGGTWKLVDFGVARRVGAADARHVMGTPAYMAPEQAMGEAVDARTDLYSLCTVAYRALTGRPPFVGGDATAIARTARAVGPPDPRRYASLPDDVVLALRVGLAARPEDRFADARELSAAFAKAFVLQLPPAFRLRARELLVRCPWAP
jgi:serine/threonine-protein kinase